MAQNRVESFDAVFIILQEELKSSLDTIRRESTPPYSGGSQTNSVCETGIRNIPRSRWKIKKGTEAESMTLDRYWAMPSRYTFHIKPIAELIEQYRPDGLSIDPFANNSRFANITNDLDPACSSDFHLDATDFLKQFQDKSVSMVLYDPPYSSRQVSECYKKLGHTVNMETTQNSYWRKHKEQISRIVCENGIVISCGWNSGGIGAKYGFEKIHIRLTAHGGNHNDTITVVERKIPQNINENPQIEFF